MSDAVRCRDERPRLRAAHFEALYRADEDPWEFATSAYEHAKYDATLDALGEAPIARALELGCSIGVLTERLAQRCANVLALDASATALARACERLARIPAADVTFALAEIPEQMPGGRFDLVLASELLYYLDRETLVDFIPRLAAAAAPGGCLVAVHWRHPTETYPLGGDEVHDLLGAHLDLSHRGATATADYRLDRWDRSG